MIKHSTSVDQTHGSCKHWAGQTSMPRNCKHSFLATADHCLPISTKKRSSRMAEFPNDLSTFQSLTDSFLIPPIEDLSDFLSSPNKVSSIITVGCVVFAMSSHEFSHKHRAVISYIPFNTSIWTALVTNHANKQHQCFTGLPRTVTSNGPEHSTPVFLNG